MCSAARINRISINPVKSFTRIQDIKLRDLRLLGVVPFKFGRTFSAFGVGLLDALSPMSSV